MINKQTASIAALCGAIGMFAGCASETNSHLVSAPPPQAPTTTQQVAVVQPQQVIVTQPQQVSVPAGTNYVVMQAPPAPQVQEAVPARPSSQHVWINGYWTWQNNRYEWMSGHWEVPPSSATAWVAPRWQQEGGSYRFYEGHWN